MAVDLVTAASRVWDFIDKREIDKHATAWAVFGVTIKLLLWTVHFASTSPRAGAEIAEIVAAIWAPWNLVQAAVVAWYFNARPGFLLREADKRAEAAEQ